MPKYVRAREPVAVRDPSAPGIMQVLNPAIPVKDNDPMVKAYPWAFISDDELAAQLEPVEAATANPGEKRTTKR